MGLDRVGSNWTRLYTCLYIQWMYRPNVTLCQVCLVGLNETKPFWASIVWASIARCPYTLHRARFTRRRLEQKKQTSTKLNEQQTIRIIKTIFTRRRLSIASRLRSRLRRWLGRRPRYIIVQLRGNHLSNTTCITHTFFKRGEQRSEFNSPYQKSNAAENRWGRIRQVALDK